MTTTTITPRLRETMAQVYREMAETNRLLGLHDLADRCERNASALLYGGSIDLEPAAESEAAA